MTSDWKRITTSDEYLTLCADRYYGEEGGQSIAMSHGQIYGDFEIGRLDGTWRWEDGFFARTSTIGDIDLGADRIVIDINDHQMRLTLGEGQGDQVVYDAKPEPPGDQMQPGEQAVCTTFDIKPEGLDDFLTAMRDNQQEVRAEAGNVEMRMFQAVDDPNAIYLFARSAPDNEEAHSSGVAERGIAETVAPTINTPPIVRQLGVTSQGGRFGPRDRSVTQDEVIVIALFEFKPGYRDRVVEQYDKQVPLVRAEPSNIMFNVFTIDGEPDKLVVYERWADNTSGTAFQSKPVSVETAELLGEAVVGNLPDYIRVLREVDPYFSA